MPTIDDVVRIVRKLKKGRAPGLDGISAELLQADPHCTTGRLHPLYIKFLMQGREALNTKAGKAVPITKGKGDPLSVGARRAIILRSLAIKVHQKFVRSLSLSLSLSLSWSR